MRQCLMMRKPFERATFVQQGVNVAFSGQLWNQINHGVEVYTNEADAIERYEEMKMIAATDYGFSVVMENIDER